MRASIIAPFAFALSALAAPVSDCESLQSLAVLNGAKLFCAEHFPASSNAVVAGTPKNNAKRFKEDDDRVMRVLGRMPEGRQKAFCECYPAVASVSVSPTPAASATPSDSATPSASAALSTSATPSASATLSA